MRGAACAGDDFGALCMYVGTVATTVYDVVKQRK